MAVRIVIDILRTVPPDDLLKDLSDIMKVLAILGEGKILFIVQLSNFIVQENNS